MGWLRALRRNRLRKKAAYRLWERRIITKEYMIHEVAKGIQRSPKWVRESNTTMAFVKIAVLDLRERRKVMERMREALILELGTGLADPLPVTDWPDHAPEDLS